MATNIIDAVIVLVAFIVYVRLCVYNNILLALSCLKQCNALSVASFNIQF